MRLPALFTVMFLAGLGCLVGCGGEKLATVTGVITLDGKPMEGLEVNFEPTGEVGDRTTGTGYTREGGAYSLHYPGFREGAPVGDYIVRISGGESLDDGTRIRVPPQFNSQSTLKQTVAPGKNSFNFELTSEQRQSAAGSQSRTDSPGARSRSQ